MPHARLMNIGREEDPALFHEVEKAAKAADACDRGTPSCAQINEPSILTSINLMGPALPILIARDPQAKQSIAKLMEPLLLTGANLDYNISNPGVFAAVFWLAALLHAKSYTPMRVMGATVEGMVKQTK
jgi:hypothetical protein